MSKGTANIRPPGSLTRVSATGTGGGRGFGKESSRLQDEVKHQRQQQLAATDVLARLMQAGDGAHAVAESLVDSLTEEFFHMGSAYLKLSEQEGDADVTSKLQAALQAAMKAKQATLRPEIQLLNSLLGAESDVRRKQILNSKEALERLLMNERYFFTLLERMTSDVAMQPDGPPKMALQDQLKAIKQDALNRIPPGAAASV